MEDQSKQTLKSSFFNQLSLMYKKQQPPSQVSPVIQETQQQQQQQQQPRDQYLEKEQYLIQNRPMYEQYHPQQQESKNQFYRGTQQYLQSKAQKAIKDKPNISNYQDYVLAKALFMSSPKIQQQLVKLILKNQQIAQDLNNHHQQKMLERLSIEDAIIKKYLFEFKESLEKKIIAQCDRHKAVFEYQMQANYGNIRHMIRSLTLQKINSLCQGNLIGKEVLQELVKNQVIKYLENKLQKYSQAISQILNTQIQALLEGSFRAIEDFYLKDREIIERDIAQSLGRLQSQMRIIEAKLTESVQNMSENIQHDQLKLIPDISLKQFQLFQSQSRMGALE